MGLEMKPSKTCITHTLLALEGPPGFDFLGFSVRHYTRAKSRGIRIGTGERLGCTPNIRPSAESQKRLLHKVREITHVGRGWPQERLIAEITPILRGRGNYFSTVVAKDIFHKMDHLIYWKLWPWARRRHSNKSRDWMYRKYWFRDGSRWVFGIEGAAKLFLLRRLRIERQVKVLGDCSPFDGDAIYWGTRMGKHPELEPSLARLLKTQRGICPCCGLFFKAGDQLESVLQQNADNAPGYWLVVHDHCQHVIGQMACLTTHHCVEEPDEGKLSRPVLKPSTDSDVRV
jgi:RNA-directed DNA polymerase